MRTLTVIKSTLTVAAVAVALSVGTANAAPSHGKFGTTHAAVAPLDVKGSGTGPLGWQTRTFTYKPAGSIFAQFLDATIVETVTEDPQGTDFSQRPTWGKTSFTPGRPAGAAYAFCSGSGSDLITYNQGVEVDTWTGHQFEKDPHTTCAQDEGLHFKEVNAIRGDGRWSFVDSSSESGGE